MRMCQQLDRVVQALRERERERENTTDSDETVSEHTHTHTHTHGTKFPEWIAIIMRKIRV